MSNLGNPAQTEPRQFWGHPYAWAVFAVALLAIPIAGFLTESSMSWEQLHPALNAALNATSAIFLVIGWRAIKAKREQLHRVCMLTAFAASSLFLVSYLIRYQVSGTHVYPGHGWDKAVYLTILFSHMVLATLVVPLILRTIYLALKDRRATHRRLARWTLPIWLYVSVTGLLVYLMLYPIAGRVYGP